jgi:hypothetical protein
MLTLKFVGQNPGEELVFEAASVRRKGDEVIYTNEHDVEIHMTELNGRSVYVMNGSGATVSTYRF